MSRRVLIIAFTFALACCANYAWSQTVRIKDMATVNGVRGNQLVGYGIIVGLQGTGDGQGANFTIQSMVNMLAAYGITVSADKLKVKNVAAVIITAELPPFMRTGKTIDVVVSSLGDCSTLQGGTLLQSPLKAANGEVYAVAQGPVSIGGFSAAGGGGSVSKNHATVGRIPGGAIVEKETSTQLAKDDVLTISLNSGDFTTASRIATAINAKLMDQVACAADPSSVAVKVPAAFKADLVGFISNIESIEVSVDSVAKVIVNERTGTVIVGGQVKVLPVAVAHGGLTVEITIEPDASQPNALSDGSTVITTKTTITAKEQSSSLAQIKAGSTIDELVRALNALKVTPRDLIAILQAIKEAGALQAQLEII